MIEDLELPYELADIDMIKSTLVPKCKSIFGEARFQRDDENPSHVFILYSGPRGSGIINLGKIRDFNRPRLFGLLGFKPVYTIFIAGMNNMYHYRSLPDLIAAFPPKEFADHWSQNKT